MAFLGMRKETLLNSVCFDLYYFNSFYYFFFRIFFLFVCFVLNYPELTTVFRVGCLGCYIITTKTAVQIVHCPFWMIPEALLISHATERYKLSRT